MTSMNPDPKSVLSKRLTPDGIASLCVIAVFGTLYMLYPSHRYFIDGITDARLMETSDTWLFHQYHDLFPFLPQIIFKVVQLIFPQASALGFLQVWASLFGVIAAWGMLLLLRAMKMSWPTTIFCLGFYGFSSGIWYFSSTASQYSTSLALSIFSLLLMVKIVRESDMSKIKTAVGWLGGLISLACYSHGANWFMLAANLLFIGKASGDNKEKRSELGFRFAFGVLAVWIIFRVLRFMFDNQPADGPDLQSQYIFYARYWATNLADGITRVFHGLVELHVAHAFHPGGIFFKDDSDTTSVLMGVLKLSQTAALIGIAYYSSLGFFESLGKKKDIVIVITRFVFIGLFIATLFFAPESTNYRIFYMPSLIVLIAHALNPAFRSGKHKTLKLIIPTILIILMFGINFTTKFLPESNIETNPTIGEAGLLSNFIGVGDLVIYSGTPEDYLKAAYVRYFTHADTITVPNFAGRLKSNEDDVLADLSERTEAGFSILIHENVLAPDEDYLRIAPMIEELPDYNTLTAFYEEHFDFVTQFEVNGRDYFIVVPKTVDKQTITVESVEQSD